MAAEPNAVRLSHLHPDCFSRTCPTCQVDNNTHHMMCECPTTEPIRQAHGLHLPLSLPADLSQAERNAFMLHGWHDHHRHQLRTLAYRVLNYKLAVFRPWHAAWLAAAGSDRQQQQ